MNKPLFMYLKLTNNHTASFYDNESMNDKSKECFFKFNPCHYPTDVITYCFKLDVTDDLRSFLKRFDVELDADVSKLQFLNFYQNGDIGPCSKK